jgi:hypothetical protein
LNSRWIGRPMFGPEDHPKIIPSSSYVGGGRKVPLQS